MEGGVFMGNEKRRDNKGRVFRENEAQRKDGRYMYKYKVNGKPKYVYSWTLESTDKTPAGKKVDKSLREKIKVINQESEKLYNCDDSKITVLEIVKKYCDLKQGVRDTTKAGYKTTINKIKKQDFGKAIICNVRTSDAKKYLIDLQRKEGYSYSQIHNIRGVLRPAFQMAVDDDLLVKNPFAFELVDVVVNDSVRREAISIDDMKRYLNFLKEDSHFSQYYDGINLLFKTGLRISEMCGLTIKDIDMVNRTININHQLQRINGKGLVVNPVKTEAGNRILPMSDEVYEIIKTLIEKRKNIKVDILIKDEKGKTYNNFLIANKSGKPTEGYYWSKKIQYSVEKYNRVYKKELPKITPHVARHTYCSINAKAGMNPKLLQYLMGHSEIGVTLDVYTHVDAEDARVEVERLEGLKRIKA